jgi:hypothetical protein
VIDCPAGVGESCGTAKAGYRIESRKSVESIISKYKVEDGWKEGIAQR